MLRAVTLAGSVCLLAGCGDSFFASRTNEAGTSTQRISHHGAGPRNFAGLKSARMALSTCSTDGNCHDLFEVDVTQDLARFEVEVAKMKSLGFNTVWLQVWWPWLEPVAYPNPVWDTDHFTALKKKLDVLRVNGMSVILPMNYFLGAPLLPQSSGPHRLEYDDFILKPDSVAAFDGYVVKVMTELESYSDMTYLMFFTENMETREARAAWSSGNGDPVIWHRFARQFRASFGTLPSRLPPALREKFTIGYHDSFMITLDTAKGELPIDPAQFDFFSTVGYPAAAWGGYPAVLSGQLDSDPEGVRTSLISELNLRLGHTHRYLPGMPVIMGETGEAQCYLSGDDRQMELDAITVGYALDHQLGFSLWDWAPILGTKSDGSPWDCEPIMGASASITRPDGSLRETALMLNALLGGTEEKRPRVDSVTPATGSGTNQVFQFRLFAPQGVNQINRAQFNFNAGLNQVGGCLVHWDHATGTFALMNDSGTSYSSTLQNSQCTVNAAASSVHARPHSLEVNVSLSFTASFAGPKTVYAEVLGTDLSYTGYHQVGEWTVPRSGGMGGGTGGGTTGGGTGGGTTGGGTGGGTAGGGTGGGPAGGGTGGGTAGGGTGGGTTGGGTGGGSTGPQVSASMTATAPSGAVGHFTFHFAHPAGIVRAQVNFNAGLDQVRACLIHWDRATNTLALMNDEGTQYQSTLENSQCLIDPQGWRAAPAADGVELTLTLAFKSSFNGFKDVHAEVLGNDLVYTGYRNVGGWQVTTQAPSISMVSSSGSGMAATLSFDLYSPLGADDVLRAQVNLNAGLNAAGACLVYYDRATGSVTLMDDAGSAYATWLPLGSANVIRNTQCTLDLSRSTVRALPTHRVLDLAMTFTPAFRGAKTVYGEVLGSDLTYLGYHLIGGWTVQ